MNPASTADHEGIFTSQRALLFTVAYELLASAADAEDVVQESWLRWAEVDLEQVREPRAYLVRVATRQALNRLRTQARRREAYVGPWLPEPVLTTPDIADDVVLADSVSTAMLMLLQSLRPRERVVFVLREVFAVEYEENATVLDTTPAAVRQLAHRARSHVAARQPRSAVGRRQQEQVTEQFLSAVATGDLESLVDVLAPDIVLQTDGGGVVQAALRPIIGVEKVLRFIRGVTAGPLEVSLATVNASAGLSFTREGRLDAVVTWEIVGGRVTQLFVQRNPAKLRRVGKSESLTR